MQVSKSSLVLNFAPAQKRSASVGWSDLALRCGSTTRAQGMPARGPQTHSPQHSTAQRSAAQRSAAQHSAAQRSAAQRSTAQRSAAHQGCISCIWRSVFSSFRMARSSMACTWLRCAPALRPARAAANCCSVCSRGGAIWPTAGTCAGKGGARWAGSAALWCTLHASQHIGGQAGASLLVASNQAQPDLAPPTCCRLRASEGNPKTTMRRSALSCSSQRSNVTSRAWAACIGASSAAGSSAATAAVSAAHCRHVGSSSSCVTCGSKGGREERESGIQAGSGRGEGQAAAHARRSSRHKLITFKAATAGGGSSSSPL